jgi:CBS domain containing-hemolysin-like protein
MDTLSIFPTITLVVTSFALVLLNGFFVAAEFAIVKVRRTRLEELAGQGVREARISIRIVDQLDEMLSATQLGITLVSLALGWIGESAFANLLRLALPTLFTTESHKAHLIAGIFAFFLITMLHVVLGELVPKSMAIQKSETVALWVAKPLSIFYRASRPLIHMFTLLANFALRQLGFHKLEEPPLSEQELKLVMKESHEEGVITESEAAIITRAFEFADKRAAEIMVSATMVDYISLSRPLDENLTIVRRHMRTRFPVCTSDFNSVVGIVHMKDVWPVMLTDFSNSAFEKCARPAIFVDSSMRQDQLLKVFQSRRVHMAIVVGSDRQGNVGLVTLEDVLEHLVGDIRDEHEH